jgi:hypothetical protein
LVAADRERQNPTQRGTTEKDGTTEMVTEKKVRLPCENYWRKRMKQAINRAKKPQKGQGAQVKVAEYYCDADAERRCMVVRKNATRETKPQVTVWRMASHFSEYI